MEIALTKPLDMHLHLREGAMLDTVGPLTSQYFSGAVVMPNLSSPVDSLKKLQAYEQEINRVCGADIFTPYMTLFFKPYSRQELEAAKPYMIGIKLYPAGITTQSDEGVSNFGEIEETLTHMQDLGIPLLVHGESGGFVMDREEEFLDVYRDVATRFPKLHIIMEHITTAAAVRFLDDFDNVSATVTLHHLLITLDDVAGGMLKPDLFCKPIAKRPEDRAALRAAVFSGHPRIMFGSDSAPHPRHKKECVGCAAGIFTAPLALPVLTQMFEKEGCLDKLQNFISGIACRRYNLKPAEKSVTLIKQEWQIPEKYGDVRPFMAGETVSWRYK